MILEQFLAGAIKQFNDYKSLADKTMLSLTDDEMHWEPVKGINSIAVIIAHMHGNMQSRWTNLLTEDGEKEWRQRDDEFKTHDYSKEKLLELWNEGWSTLLTTLENLSTADLEKTIYIRTKPLSVMDAVLRQLTHYASHVGQIIYLGKIMRGERWESLSIPRGESLQYLENMKNKP